MKIEKRAMHIYHRVVDINYRNELISKKRLTPAGEYQSFELISGHKSDVLLELISENACPDDTIYDVGAYCGDYALPLSNEYTERVVVALEPNETSIHKLRKNIKQTQPKGRLIIEPTGVGASFNKQEFYISSFRKTSSFNRDDATRWNADIVRTQQKKVMPIDVLSRYLPNPDHIKIDTEGFAPEVLRGCVSVANSEQPIIYIEPHDTTEQNRTEQIIDWCSDNGYDMETKNEAIICRPES